MLGHRKLPEKFCEFMTPAIEAKLAIVCVENAGCDGVSAIELKCAVNPLDV